MGRISQWAVRQPIFALITWFVLMAGIVVASILFGGEYNDDFELPDTESTTAQDLLGQLSGSAGTGAGLKGQIVWSADSGEVTDEGTQQVITDLLTEISSPQAFSAWCLPTARHWVPIAPSSRPTRAAATERVQAVRRVRTGRNRPRRSRHRRLRARWRTSARPASALTERLPMRRPFSRVRRSTISTTRRSSALEPIKAQNGEDGLQVGANGVFAFVSGEEPSSESIGVAVALVILLFAFGALAGALLPIVSAIVSVSISTGFVLPLVAASSTSPSSRRSSRR